MGLAELDKSIFKIINYQMSNPVFDLFMPFIRNQYLWMPLYIFLIVFILTNFKKTTAWYLVFAIGTVILSNFISSDLIKGNIYRLRPCNDPSLANYIHVLVGYRPQSSSFTSSHATNHFAMAAFFYYTLKKYLGNYCYLFMGWAAIICFAQIYVGVHFPFDILAGAAIGFVLGYLSARSFNRNYGLIRAA
ncbi:MAG: phosphatase PAP2 family protein [Ferruginibacter sp.]|nr:phosphatase PAP2 family protein [Ferruginibacter sp.]